MKPGIYNNISNNDYHSGEGVSKTQLDKIAVSPAHYMQHKKEARKQTGAFSIGTEAHRLILQPEEKKEYILKPSISRRSKADREEWKSFFCENGADGESIINNPAADWDSLFCKSTGIFLLNAEEIEIIKEMRDSVMSHPSASQLLAKGVAEQSAYWIDEETGLLCRCRPDWQNGPVLVDLKTTKDASPRGFGRSAASLRYHVQSAFYGDGVNAAGGTATDFAFIAVEKDPPYAVAVYVAEPEHNIKGRELYRKDLATLKESLDSCIFKGYGDDPMPLELPVWALD